MSKRHDDVRAGEPDAAAILNGLDALAEQDRANMGAVGETCVRAARLIRSLLAVQSGAGSGPHKPKVICLSGSTRFLDFMAVRAWEMEKQGHVVLSCHLLPGWYTDTPHHLAEEQGVAERLDALHLRKIDMADEVVVIAPGGYVGESTRREIAHAEASGKPIKYETSGPANLAQRIRNIPVPADLGEGTALAGAFEVALILAADLARSSGAPTEPASHDSPRPAPSDPGGTTAMKRIYRIEYELHYEGLREWTADTKNVLANGDAEQAIAKLRNHEPHKWSDPGDSNAEPPIPPRVRKLIGFRVKSVEILAEAEL